MTYKIINSDLQSTTLVLSSISKILFYFFFAIGLLLSFFGLLLLIPENITGTSYLILGIGIVFLFSSDLMNQMSKVFLNKIKFDNTDECINVYSGRKSFAQIGYSEIDGFYFQEFYEQGVAIYLKKKRWSCI